MKSAQRSLIILLCILTLGIVLRAYHLTQIPAILNRDEAALAYNAYLLQDTGTDEWGERWPLTLRSFGDYKLIGYPLLVIGSYHLFGVNDFAVKFPSFVAGSMLIVLGYLFAKELKIQERHALFFSFVIATTPVFFFYSRIAFEANVALSYFVGALYLIFYKTKKENKTKRIALDFFATFLLLLAVFTYNTPLLILPFIIIFVPFLRGLKNVKHWLFLEFGLSLVLILGGITLFRLSGQKSGITIFSDETVWMQSVIYRNQFTGIWQRILGNRYIFWLGIILENYWKSFSYWFLVSKGGSHPWHTISGFGHILGGVYVLGLIGIFSKVVEIFKEKIPKGIQSLSLLFLLFISLLPSAVTVDSPHATRSLLFIFLFSVFAVYGLRTLQGILLKKMHFKKQYVMIFVLGVLIAQSVGYFKNYFFDYAQHLPDSLNEGFRELIQESNNQYPNKKIAVVDEGGFQYVVTAWYLKIPPQDYRSSIIMQLPDKIGFHYGERVENYHFVVNADDRNEDERVVLEKKNDVWEIQEY